MPAVPLLAKSFNVSFGVASLVIITFILGQAAGSLPTGALIDRLGARQVMIIGPILTALMAGLVMTAQSFPEILVLRFIDGWAAQMWLMGRITSISALADAQQRGRQINWMLGMDNVGKLTGPLVGGFIAAAWGVRVPFGAYAALALVALIPVFFLAEDVRTTKAKARDEGSTRLGWALRQLVLPKLGYFGVAFFGAVCRGPVGGNLLHLYAAFTYNLDAPTIGILAAASSSTLVPIGFAAGYMLDRIGRRWTIAPGYLCFTVAMLWIAGTALLHLSFLWYVGGFIGVVASQGLTVGSTQVIGADIAPNEGRGSFLGVWQLVNLSGSSVSPLVFAFLADKAGYDWSFVVLAGAALAAGVLLLLLPETGRAMRKAAAA